MKKKNVLFILPFFPYPLISGGHQAIFHGIKILQENYNVFIYYEEGWNECTERFYNEFQEKIGFSVNFYKYKLRKTKHYIYYRIKNNIKKLFEGEKNLKSIYLQDPYIYIRDTPLGKMSDDKISFVNKIIQNNKIDIVQCEMLETIGFIHSIPQEIKTIFIHHEIGFAKEESLVRSTCSDFGKYQNKLSTSKKFEVDILNKYDIVVTLSKEDAFKLKKAGVYTTILPSFCIVNNSFVMSEENCNPFRLTFVGSGNHPPNNDGLKWFLNKCWGKIRKIDSRYSLSVVGLWDNECIDDVVQFTTKKKQRTSQLEKQEQIRFEGFVDDLNLFLNKSITICPIRYGSGIRMKLLEASNACSPIVSTSIGAEGIPFQSYTGNNASTANCILANTPEEFIKSIVKLQDKDLVKNLTCNAKSMVTKIYNIEKLAINRLPIYQ